MQMAKYLQVVVMGYENEDHWSTIFISWNHRHFSSGFDDSGSRRNIVREKLILYLKNNSHHYFL